MHIDFDLNPDHDGWRMETALQPPEEMARYGVVYDGSDHKQGYCQFFKGDGSALYEGSGLVYSKDDVYIGNAQNPHDALATIKAHAARQS